MIDLNRVRQSDLWYAIGYIVADGCLAKDGCHIDITSKDKKHLILLKRALYLRNKIGIKYRSNERIKPYYRLQFGDVNFYKYLLGIGIHQNKSLSLGEIKINDAFFTDFLRGIIDGDGNISTWIHTTNYNRQWCLRVYSASPIFIKWLDDEIKNHFGIEGKLYSLKHDNKDNIIYRLKYGKKAAEIILKNIYYSRCLALERKALQAKACLQNSNKMIH